jgi:hypothetical protein
MPLVPVISGHVLTFTATTLDPAPPLPSGPCIPLEAKIEAPLSVQGHSGAGYHDCWVRVADSSDLRITYCRGIGLVHMWDAANNYELELATKNV